MWPGGTRAGWDSGRDPGRVGPGPLRSRAPRGASPRSSPHTAVQPHYVYSYAEICNINIFTTNGDQYNHVYIHCISYSLSIYK